MAKRNQGNGDSPEKEGYRPLNVGYTPTEPHGGVPTDLNAELPRAPRGGSGERSPNTPSERPGKPAGS